jgi:VanZ family protein
MWSYLSLLTYELLLKNPWVILGDKIASDPPLDTASLSASALLHTVAFGILGFLATFALQDKPEKDRVRYSLWFILYSGVTELLQSFVPNRWPSGEDILFNVIGLAIGMVVFYRIAPKVLETHPESAELSDLGLTRFG